MYNIYHIDGGIGKNIMGTAVCREINDHHRENKTIVVCSYPEIFLHNPNIYRIYRSTNTPYFYDDFVKNKNSLIFKFDPYNATAHIQRKEHLTDTWCDIFKLKNKLTTPELYFNKMEDRNLLLLKQKYSPDKPYIIVQINGGLGHGENHIPMHWYRDIPPFYYQNLINAYRDKFNFILFKHANQLSMEGVIEPNLSLRESLNMMRGAEGALCIDSMAQHAMAALNKPSLVCWIGNSPTVFGYPMHTNVVSNFVNELENPEGYLDPYALQSEGYQCPINYDQQKLFDINQLHAEFASLFIKK